ncbi:uncharacterized protein [Atheta coriaria]
MDSKSRLFVFTLIVLLNLVPNKCNARSLEKNPEGNILKISERECNLLLKRLKRDADNNFIEDDDAFIENLIKSTLTKEKQKCIDKYHLLEMPRRVTESDDADEARELRREVAKLKDLVNVIKDQRYILNSLDVPAQKHVDTDVVHSKTSEHQQYDTLRDEMRKLQNQIENAQPKAEISKFKDTHKAEVQDKLDKQQLEITNLKNLLQGVLVEMKAVRKQSTTTTTTESPKASQDITQMIQELSLLEKKLSNMQHQPATSGGNTEVVAMRPPSGQPPFAINQNGSLLSQTQGRSASASERASEDELDALLSVLTPEKSTSSVESLLKSLDSDSDDEIQRRIQTLEKQMKRRKKQQLEDQLKNLERQLTHSSSQSIQSKSDDSDLGDNAQLKRLLVKMIKKKNQQTESKSLDDDEVLDELKALQKSIKSLSTDDDDLFDDLEEKNGSLDVTIEKLINAGGSGGGIPHRRRKLSQAQIKALRRRIMAMKQGNSGGGSDYSDVGDLGGGTDSEHSLYGSGHGQGHGYGHGEDFGPHWHVTPIGPGGTYAAGQADSGFYGAGGPSGYAHEGFGQYGHGSSAGQGGPSYGPNKYGPMFGNADHFYGNQDMYSNIPTNQFGTPVYPGYAGYHGGYPVYSGYQGGASYASPANIANSGSYGSSKYFGSATASASGAGSYQGAGVANYKSFFPAAQESPGSSYHPQQNSGTPGAAQSYQNQPTSNNLGPASVTDLKNQIYELQGVINTFNKPEYVQKPEDKAIVYNLNKQISELKGVVNTLQDTPYSGGPGSAQSETAYVAPHSDVYAPAAAGPGPGQSYSAPAEQETQPHSVPLQPQPQPPAVYAAPAQPQAETQPQGEYQHPPAARSYQNYRKRRGIDVHSAIHRNEEVINTLGALLGNILGVYDENNMVEAEPPPVYPKPEVPRVFDDINAKIADVRKQLDHRMYQQRQRLNQPLLPQLLRPAPQLRSNEYDSYNNYDSYDDGYGKNKETKLFKVKKDDKKSDVFDK